MIKIINGQIEGKMPQTLSYIEGRSFFSTPLLKLTRWLRASNCQRYMPVGERHLDIGCGDGYFLIRSAYQESYGLDNRLGDEFKDYANFQNDYFDVVTMLAVIEHIHDPLPLLKEIRRILKPGGFFVLTTPKKIADLLIKIYARDIDEEHEIYYNYENLKELTNGLFEIRQHHTFIFGMNQAFCLQAI